MNVKSIKSSVLPATMMFALFFIVAFVTGLQNPMGIIVKSQFSASNFLSQLGNLANFIAYAFMGIPAGLLLQKYGYKKTALTAVVVGLIGVCVTWLSGRAGSYGVYLTGAFVSGFSMCMLNTTINPMLKTLGATEKRGNQLLQFGGAFNSLGATVAPILVGYLMGSSDKARTIADANPALYIAMGIFILTFIVLIFADMPEPHATMQRRERKEKTGALSFRHFRFGIAAVFLYVGVEVSIPNISNLYMTQQLGIDTAIAGSIVGTYWLLMLAGRILGGMAGGKVSAKGMLTFAASLGLVFVLLAMFTLNSSSTVSLPVFHSDTTFGLEQLPVSLMFLILCGLATSVMWGSVFSLATAGLGRHIAAASGILMTMVSGGGIMPAFQAWIADMTTYAASFWVVMASLSYLLFYAIWGSRNINTDIDTN